MKALISGQAGLAVVLGDPPSFRPTGEPAYQGSQESITHALNGFGDVEEVEFSDGDVGSVDRRVTRAWAIDRAIYRYFMLFDMQGNDLDLENRVAAECSQLTSQFQLSEDLKAWFHDVDLGEDHDTRAAVLARRHPGLRDVLASLCPRSVTAEQHEARGPRLAPLRPPTKAVRAWSKLVNALPEATFAASPRRSDSKEQLEARKIATAFVRKHIGLVTYASSTAKQGHDARQWERLLESIALELRLEFARVGVQVEPYNAKELEAIIRQGMRGVTKVRMTQVLGAFQNER